MEVTSFQIFSDRLVSHTEEGSVSRFLLFSFSVWNFPLACVDEHIDTNCCRGHTEEKLMLWTPESPQCQVSVKTTQHQSSDPNLDLFNVSVWCCSNAGTTVTNSELCALSELISSWNNLCTYQHICFGNLILHSWDRGTIVWSWNSCEKSVFKSIFKHHSCKTN